MHLPDRVRSPGFSLIELMVTLTVLMVVLVAAVPSFADFFDKYRLRGAVDDVVSVVSNARASSVKNDRDVNVSFGGTTSAWCIGANSAVEPTGGNPATGAATCNCADSAQCRVAGDRMALDVGQEGAVSVDSVATSFGYSSKFGLIDPLGDAAATTFTSPRGKYQLRLNVNALGQASVCVPAGKPVIAGVTPC